MSGVNIAQVKPIAQKGQYMPKPPRHNNTYDDEHNQTIPKANGNRSKKPTSTRRRIAQNVVGLKDLLFKGEDVNMPKKKHKSRAGSSRVNLQLPIGNIQTNTFIIQINNQPVKLPQSDLSFVMDEADANDQARQAVGGGKYSKINRRIRLKNPKAPNDNAGAATNKTNGDMPSELNSQTDNTMALTDKQE